MKLYAQTKNISLDLSLANERIQMLYRDKSVVSASLKQVLIDAEEQGRLTCGIYDSGTLLSKSPEDVMMCVLPEDSSNDVALHIHFTLIEAFCWENDIPIIKVDSADKIKKILGEIDRDETGGVRWPMATDYNCLLVEFPNDECSTEEEDDVLDFCKLASDAVPQMILELEV